MKKLFATLAMLAAFSASAFEATCSVEFSPKGSATAVIVGKIDAVAGGRIDILTYSFTSEPIANALIRAARRGVQVNAVIDSDEVTKKNNKVAAIRDAGANTYLDHAHAIQHNKVILINDDWLHTGSFNFSANAEKRNGENSLWCQSKEGVRIYRENFELHRSHAKRFE